MFHLLVEGEAGKKLWVDPQGLEQKPNVALGFLNRGLTFENNHFGSSV